MRFFLKRNLAKESIWLGLNQLFSFALSILLLKLLAVNIPKSQLGWLYMLLTVSSLFSQLVFGGLTNAFSRYYAIAKEEKKISDFSEDVAKLIAYGLGLCAVISLILLVGLKIYNVDRLSQYFLVFIYSSLVGVNGVFSGIENSARKRNVVAFNTLVLNASRIFLTAVALKFFKDDSIDAILMAYNFSVCLCLISQLVFIKNILPKFSFQSLRLFNGTYSKEILKYALPFSSWGLITWIYTSSDKWAIDLFDTTDNVAAFSAIYQIGYSPILLLVSTFITFVHPILFEKSGSNKDFSNSKTKSMGLILLISSFIIALIVAFLGLLSTRFGDKFINLALGNEYIHYSQYLVWFIVAAGLYSISQLMSLNYMIALESKKLASIKISTSVLGVALNFTLVFHFGLNGAIISMVIYSLLNLSIQLIHAKKVMH